MPVSYLEFKHFENLCWVLHFFKISCSSGYVIAWVDSDRKSFPYQQIQQALVRITLALAVIDYAALGFDPNVYSDPACKQMLTPISTLPPGLLGYLKVKDEVIRLRKLLFIRSGLICRGTRCFSADSNSQSALIVKTVKIEVMPLLKRLRSGI